MKGFRNMKAIEYGRIIHGAVDGTEHHGVKRAACRFELIYLVFLKFVICALAPYGSRREILAHLFLPVGASCDFVSLHVRYPPRLPERVRYELRVKLLQSLTQEC